MDNKEMPLDLTNEGVLREYIKNVVHNAVEDVLLNEMAFPLKNYKDRVRNYAVDIATHWCLIRYTFYNENFLQLRNHWKSELKTFLNKLALMKVTPKKQYDTKYRSVLSVWAEYEFDRDEYSISSQIANKFEEEGISIYSPEFADVVNDFKNETLNIANVIADGDRLKVNEYVEQICS
jgi:hypothetical protein